VALGALAAHEAGRPELLALSADRAEPGKDAAQRSRSYLRSDSVNPGEYAAVVTYSLHETFTVRVHVGRDDAGRLTYSKKPGPRFSTF
jgi:hypothetical protein